MCNAEFKSLNDWLEEEKKEQKGICKRHEKKCIYCNDCFEEYKKTLRREKDGTVPTS